LGAKREDLNGVIDYINSMPEAKYSVLLSEDEKGNVKASLRTRKSDVDVKSLAEKFGGGGHVKAAGFTIAKSKLEKEVKWKIVQE
jgi:phosphoesterase RecJ-like protein